MKTNSKLWFNQFINFNAIFEFCLLIRTWFRSWLSENTTSSDNNLKSNASPEILEPFTKKDFEGTWSIGNPQEKSKLSSHIDSSSGTASIKLFYEEEKKHNSVKISSILYDGEYRDKVVYLTIRISDIKVFKSNESEIWFYDAGKPKVTAAYGRLYSIYADYQCHIDNVNATFTRQPHGNFRANLTLYSKDNCFPKKLEMILDTVEENVKAPRNRVMRYSFLLNLLLMLYCYCTSKQCYEAEQNDTTAKRISMISLSWNTIWNFCCFNIHLTYSLQFSEYGYFAIPACMYFVLWFIFQLKFLLVWWKAKHSHLFPRGNEEVRKALIRFYIKFYLIALVSLITVDKLIANKYTLFAISGLVLIPQIVLNAINKSRNTPSMSFAVLMAVTQAFFPLYIRGCPQNILELKPDVNWATILMWIIFAQIAILFLQRKWGSRFFIPKLWRFWNEHNYYKNFSDDLEQGENQDGATTCCICLNPLSFNGEQEPNNNSESNSRSWGRFFNSQNNSRVAKKYMVTPCGHKYHPRCLKSWMREKLECPFCRAPIPAVDEID